MSFKTRTEDPVIFYLKCAAYKSTYLLTYLLTYTPTTGLGAESEPGDGGEHSEEAD